MSRRPSLLVATTSGLFFVLGWQLWISAQQPRVEKAQPAASNRFEFEVISSFDAKYEGDTPGHVGRSGGLENRKLQVALGDPVFRGEQQIGKITGLGWSRVHGSLEVEFDPVNNARICVGDVVWLALDGQFKPAAAR
jgi:hypothetical protein